MMPIESKAMQESPATHDDRALVGGGGQQSHAVQDVDRAMTKGALWMILARLGDRSLGIISTVILVRLLAPADFGLVAMGTSLIALCEVMGQVGLDIALIQNPDATRSHYDTAWTFSVILSAMAAVILLLLAIPAANFYDEPRLVPILLSLALGSVISGFENIGIVAFRKELQFNKEFQFFFGKKLIGFLFTVPLAFLLRNYWALIVGIIIGRLAGVGLSYYVQDYRPRWSLAARKDLFHFSKWMVMLNIGSVFNSRAADFIVGKIAGPHALGVFNVSYELSNLPTTELIAPINRAVFPGYARKADDNAALKEGYLDVLGMIVAIAVPAGVGIAATSRWFVPLVLGQQWSDAVPLITVLSFYAILTAIKTNSHYVYLALGKPNVATYLGIVQISFLLPSLVVLSREYGGIGAAYGYLVSQAIFTPISFSVLFRVMGVTPREIIRVLWRPIVSAAIMYLAVRLVAIEIPVETFDSVNVLLRHFLIAVAIGAAAYTTCLFVAWNVSARPVGAETRILGAVRSIKLWSRSRGMSASRP